MRVFHALDEAANNISSSAIAIGNFDGIHLGHQTLLTAMLSEAKRLATSSCILTFYPHPVELLHPERKRERIFTAAEKLATLEEMGIENVLVAPFDAELSNLSAREFFDNFLKSGLKAKSVTVGFDFRFGKNRQGDTKLLTSWCKESGIEVIIVPALEGSGVKISSSSIKDALREGNVDLASQLLGRPYSISGVVSHGDNRGEQIGFPTANLQFAQEKLLPRDGVYVTRAVWQKQVFPSVTNVGVRPTFHKENDPRTVEVHLMDFKARLYDESIKVDFLKRIRDEIKFASVTELTAQIKKDVQYARDSFKGAV